MIPQEFIQSLLGRVDIVDVVDRHVKLKKAGANFSACCPFHNEKTPSFTVSPTKQFYHCFGCGAHGNAIGFLMEYSGLAYPEAIRALAETVGMPVPETRSRSEGGVPSQAPGLAARMLEAVAYYRAELENEDRDRIFFWRAFQEIAAVMGWGTRPMDGRTSGVYHAATAPLSDTGLVIDTEPDGEKSRRYDRCVASAPILDARGTVTVGGRSPGEPSSTTRRKRRSSSRARALRALPGASRYSRPRPGAVVEATGTWSPSRAHGVENAVATLGTATTPRTAVSRWRRTPFLFRRRCGTQGRMARAPSSRRPCSPTESAELPFPPAGRRS
jgi:DNA primase